jgi:hypothetical protein
MNTTKMPGFTAEGSLYKASRLYLSMPISAIALTQVVPQITPRYGLCMKASRFCQRGTEQPWCAILDACFDGEPDPLPQPPDPLPQPCVPTTICRQDPATSNPRCQICTRDYCDGTATRWFTC